MKTSDIAKLVGQNVKAMTAKYGFVHATIERITKPNWMSVGPVATIVGVAGITSRGTDRRFRIKSTLVYLDEPGERPPSTFDNWCWLNRSTSYGEDDAT